MTFDEAKKLEEFKAGLAAREKSLEMLYDYTKFHIGVFLTLTTVCLAAASVKISDSHDTIPLSPTNKCFLIIAAALFLVAGAAAGIIVSKIPEYDGGGSGNDFLKTKIGPFCLKPFTGCVWSTIQHICFWLGILIAIASISYAIIFEPAKPKAPTITFAPVMGMPAASGVIAVTIKEPKNNGGSASAQYTVTSQPEGSKSAGGKNSGDGEGLKAVTYTLTVTATDAAGTGVASKDSAPASGVLPGSIGTR